MNTARTPDNVFPYPMKAAVGNAEREVHMGVCLSRGLPVIAPRPKNDGTIQIIGYGPSLRTTWMRIDPSLPVMTVSGAHNFLVERGIDPTHHVDMDPRPHKLQFIADPHPSTHFIMASCCNPLAWSLLRASTVSVFHVWNGAATETWCANNNQTSAMVYTGSHVGACAMRIAQLLGYSRLIVHGMDMSFTAAGDHAGVHGGLRHPRETRRVGGKDFITSKISINMAEEMLHRLGTDEIDVTFYGDGMLQALVAERNLPNARCK